MKRLVPLLAALMLCSCSVMTHQRYVSTMFLDFRPYTEAGFFISPNPYTGEFSPLGEINIVVQDVMAGHADSFQFGRCGDMRFSGSGCGRIRNSPWKRMRDSAKPRTSTPRSSTLAATAGAPAPVGTEKQTRQARYTSVKKQLSTSVSTEPTRPFAGGSGPYSVAY